MNNKDNGRGRKLKAMYTNADQFLNKRDELVEVTGNEPDIMITEVIPKAQIKPIEEPLLNITGYKIFKNFDISLLNLGASGIRGMAIYLKEDLIRNEVTFDAGFNEQCVGRNINDPEVLIFLFLISVFFLDIVKVVVVIFCIIWSKSLFFCHFFPQNGDREFSYFCLFYLRNENFKIS